MDINDINFKCAKIFIYLIKPYKSIFVQTFMKFNLKSEFQIFCQKPIFDMTGVKNWFKPVKY